MPLKVQSLSDLSADDVQQLQAEMVQLLQDKYPEMELSRGVIHDLIAYFSGGISGAINQTEINRVLESRSLLAIGENPALADEELVDHVLSNWGVTRRQGSVSSGELTLVVSENVSTVIPASSVFIANGLRFTVDAVVVARPVGSTVSQANETVLSPLGNGTFSFSIDLTAEAVGTLGNVKRGTRFSPETAISRLVTAYAASDFTDGSDTETNAELISRLQVGIAATAWSNRTNITKLIQSQPEFEDAQQISIVGHGNPEMLRDQHSIFPISFGGRTDIYIRTQPLPQSLGLTKNAVFVDAVADGGIWQLSFTKDEAAGFYEVTQITRPDDPIDNSGYSVLATVRGSDMTDDTFVPDVINAEESAFSRYQTVVVQFLDTDTDTTGLSPGVSIAEYRVAVAVMPKLSAVQSFCAGRDVRNTAADILVKAPVPCFVAVELRIEQATGETTPDAAALANVVAAAINAQSFTGQIHSSIILDAVHDYLSEKQAIADVYMVGRILRPDGETVYIRDGQVIRIPDDPNKMVTGRTVAFYSDPANVFITTYTQGYEQPD